MVTLDSLIAAARGLASDGRTNPEYDRALVELVMNAAPGLDNEDDTREWLESRILSQD